jgi:hypothetical protein
MEGTAALARGLRWRVGQAGGRYVGGDLAGLEVLFVDALGLPLEGEGDGYHSSGTMAAATRTRREDRALLLTG